MGNFPLPTGHELPEGVIVDLTDTAYKVAPVAGAAGDVVFVPFVRVHQPQPVAGLVAFADGSVYGGAR